jgi:hypothetical protein
VETATECQPGLIAQSFCEGVPTTLAGDGRQVVTVDGVKHIGIYAKRRIEPGEELTYDYKFQEETDPARKVPCNCGAKGCRKWMC